MRILPIHGSVPKNQENITKTVRTVVTQQKFVVNPVDSHRSEVILLFYELERIVRWVQQTLRVQALEVDNFKAPRTTDAQLGLQEVDGARLDRDVEFLQIR
jgi:hypothetical protein